MNNIYIIFAIFTILIIFGVCWVFIKKESFTDIFNKSPSSTENFQYVDMGDHSTLSLSMRGNNDKTVLLFHNSPLNMEIWVPLFETMQRLNMSGVKTPNLVTYDIRGHGTAWMPVDPKFNDLNINNYAWSIDTFVVDAKKIYDNIIGGGKVILCGFGFGGTVAQKLALTYPDIVEKLIVLQTTVRPMPGLTTEINFLGGPNGWIAKNPSVTYLTSDEKYVNIALCEWFYLGKSEGCAHDPRMSKYDDHYDQLSAAYQLAAKMWRQSSSTTTLQTDKLLASLDLTKEWENAKDIPFSIHLLAGKDDPLSPPDMMTDTFTTIYNKHRNTLVVLDIVEGRHGFAIIRPDYIAGIITDNYTVSA